MLFFPVKAHMPFQHLNGVFVALQSLVFGLGNKHVVSFISSHISSMRTILRLSSVTVVPNSYYFRLITKKNTYLKSSVVAHSTAP